jgi:nucleoid-associated protein YgaU
MGKEAKIGLAVIAVLVVILVVVVVRRVTGSRDAEVASNESSKTAPNDKTAFDRDKAPPAPKPVAFQSPIVVPTQTPASKRPGPAESGGFAMASDGGKGRSPSVTPPPPPPLTRDLSTPPPVSTLGPSPHPSPDGNPWRQSSTANLVPVGTSPDPFLPPSGPSGSGNMRPTDRTNPSLHAVGYPHGPRAPDPASAPDPSSSRNDGYARNFSPGYPSNNSPNNTFRPVPSSEPNASRDGYESARIEPKLTRRHDFTTAGSSLSTGRLGANPDGTYVIQPNDSYWAISRNLYGTGAYFKALAEHNRAKYAQEDQLRVGDTVAAPDPAELEQKYPDLCPSPKRRETARQRAATVTNVSSRYAGERVYTVEEGDTLYDIARYQLGKGARWPEIYELNRESLQDNFDYLTPGLKLVMPNSQTDAVTRRPGAASSR